jgi:hypothetical protein
MADNWLSEIMFGKPPNPTMKCVAARPWPRRRPSALPSFRNAPRVTATVRYWGSASKANSRNSYETICFSVVLRPLER